MADPQTADQGFLAGLLGKFGADPAAAYGGLLSDPATQRQFALRSLGAAAQAFGQGAMPVPYKGGIPFGATLGAAGGAASTAGDALMHARLEAAQAGLANQTVEATRTMMPMYQALFDQAKTNAAGGGVAATGGTGAKPLTGPAKIIAGGGGALAGNADPNIIKNVLAITNQRGYTPVATTALVGAGLGEGGFAKPWAPSGVADANSPTGQELSYGPWQLHKGGELDGYLQAGNKPGDINAQTNYVADRLDVFAKKLGYQDFGSITDPKAAANVVRAFENGKPGADYYASHFPAAANLIAQHSGAQTASTGDQPPAADLGPQTASGGAYSVPPPPGPPPKPGEYTTPVRAGNVPLPPAAAPPMAPSAAPPGGLLKLPDPTSAAPPQLATPPAVTGLLGQQPTQQVAAADAPQLSPAAAAVLQGINRQQAGGGLLASGSVAGGNAVPTAEPPAVAQAGPPHTGAAGAAELAGLLAQPPAPAGPPTATPYTNAPPVTGVGASAPGPQVIPGPQPTPLAAPPGPPMPTLPPPPSQMPQIPQMPAPQPTPGQAAAMGIAGISALIGKPAPEWIQQMAAMPGQQAMEVFKSWLGVQTSAMNTRDAKQVEMAAAPYIAAASAAAKLPYTFVRAGESLPTAFDANGKPTAWTQAPGEPTMVDGPLNAQGQPTKRYWIPATRQLIDLGASGPSAAQTSAGTESGKYAPASVPGAPQTSVPNFKPIPNAPPPDQKIQSPRGTFIPGTDRQTLPTNYPDYAAVQTGDDGWNSWKHDMVTAQTMGGQAEAQIGMIIQAAKANEMGSGTEARANLGNFLISNLHVDPKWVNENLANVGEVQKMLYAQARDTLTTLAAVNKRFTGGEFKITSQTGTSPEQLNAANLPILAQDLAKVRQIQGVAENWGQAQRTTYADGSKWTNPQDFVSSWYEMNPLAKLQAQTMQQIGPLKGMSQVPGVPEGATSTGRTIGGWPEFQMPDGRKGTFPGQWKDR